MSLADRLRSVVRPTGPARPCLGGGWSGAPGSCEAIAETLGGEWREVRGQQYLIIDRRYPAGHRLGRVTVADCLPAADGLWPRMDLLMHGGAGAGTLRGRPLFVDLETTGLAGGAGTYAFLVGCGWFEGGAFRVRQFFLSSYAAERGLLEDVAAMLGAAGALVTYNGKSFDVPLVDTRFLFHRMEAPFIGLPHLDMLHCARRLWRTADAVSSADPAGEPRATCRLGQMEQAVLGHVREGDVPGFEIPARYFHYVRTGDAQQLNEVMEHNRLDLLALAMLTARAVRLLEEGADGARTAREALGLGRLYERGGMMPEARACLARAAGADLTVRPYDDGDALTVAEALRAYGALCRRERRYADAADAWRRLLALGGCPPRLAQEATEALAVHHEHRLRDLRAARQFAMESRQFGMRAARAQAARHRLARIDRKLGSGGPTPGPAPLF